MSGSQVQPSKYRENINTPTDSQKIGFRTFPRIAPKIAGKYHFPEKTPVHHAFHSQPKNSLPIGLRPRSGRNYFSADFSGKWYFPVILGAIPGNVWKHILGYLWGYVYFLCIWRAVPWTPIIRLAPDSIQGAESPAGARGCAQDTAQGYVPSISEIASVVARLTGKDLPGNLGPAGSSGVATAGGLAPRDAAGAGGLAPRDAASAGGLAPRRKRAIELDALAGQGPQQRLKSRKIIFCLAEALRDRWREAIRESSSICLMQDKRDVDHVVRFACASDRKLKLTCGVLSVEHAIRGDAKSSKQYTLSALERFCRRDDGAPARGPASTGLARCADAGGLAPCDPALDSECLRRLRGQTHTLVADGAPSEQKCLRALRDEGSLPGVLLIARDKAHAARSVLTRPTEKLEKWLNDFLNDLVFKKKSAVHIIQNSIQHRHLFQQQGTRVEREVDTAIIDLGFAPHRFESRLKPLVRICLCLDQFLTTCVSIAVSRASMGEGKKMCSVLNRVTPESLFMVALLADAVSEGLQFLRRVDKEETHTETLFADVQEYRLRLLALFGEHGCAYDAQRSVGTFAHIVHGALLRERALVFPGAHGGAHVVGGEGSLSSEVVQRCAVRMRDWVSMCFAALDTEFPEWELAQAFRVFDLSPKGSWWLGPASREMVTESIGRLAHKCGVDPNALASQLEAVLPLARRRWHALGTSKAAMVAAIEEFSSRAKVADHLLRGLEALRRVVCVWLTATFSTTGVEHMFVGAANVLRKRRGPIGRARRHDELIVLHYAQAHGWKALLNAWPEGGGLAPPQGGGLAPPQGGGLAPPRASKAASSWGRAAQDVWKRCYPLSRQRLLVRRDAGGRRVKLTRLRTESGFLRARRQAVDDKVVMGPVAGGLAPLPPEDGLAPSGDAAKEEVLLQKARRVQKMCAEAGQNAFPANDSVSGEVRRAVRLASGRMVARVDSVAAKRGALVPLGKIVERLRARAKVAAAAAQTRGSGSTASGGSSAGRRHGPASAAQRPAIPIVPLTAGRLPAAALARCQAVARGVFVQPGLALSDGERQELRRKGLAERHAALDSDIFLVERFSGVDHNVLLSMFLVGGKLVTRSFLQRGRGHGPATLQFVPAPFVRRLWLSFSAQLRGARPRQVQMVEDATMRPGSAWSVVSETQWPKWHSSPKRNQCFAVYTSAEIGSMANPHHGAISWSRARMRSHATARCARAAVAHRVYAPMAMAMAMAMAIAIAIALALALALAMVHDGMRPSTVHRTGKPHAHSHGRSHGCHTRIRAHGHGHGHGHGHSYRPGLGLGLGRCPVLWTGGGHIEGQGQGQGNSYGHWPLPWP